MQFQSDTFCHRHRGPCCRIRSGPGPVSNSCCVWSAGGSCSESPRIARLRDSAETGSGPQHLCDDSIKRFPYISGIRTTKSSCRSLSPRAVPRNTAQFSQSETLKKVVQMVLRLTKRCRSAPQIGAERFIRKSRAARAGAFCSPHYDHKQPVIFPLQQSERRRDPSELAAPQSSIDKATLPRGFCNQALNENRCEQSCSETRVSIGREASWKRRSNCTSKAFGLRFMISLMGQRLICGV